MTHSPWSCHICVLNYVVQHESLVKNNTALYIRVQKRWHHKKLFLHFSVLDTMYRWSMMRNIHSPNLTWIGSWGPKIWLHDYLISPIEISISWPGSKQLWIRPIYTDFNGANKVFIQPYLGPPWTNSCQIWCEGFSSCSTETWGMKMPKCIKKIWWCHTSVLYSSTKSSEACFNFY